MKTDTTETLTRRAPRTDTQTATVYSRTALAGVLPSGWPKSDITAIVDGVSRYSMLDLLERARDIAAVLRAAPDGPVAVALPLGFEQIASCLAALGSRRMFFCIDLRDPTPFVAGILAGIQPAIVLCNEAPEAVLPASSAIIVPIGAIGSSADDLLDFDAAFADLDRPAAVFFTSGSTGDAKGVANSVGALLAKTTGYAWQTGQRAIAHASPMFRVSTNEWLVPVLAGATVHIVDARNGVESIVNAVETIRPTRFRCNASLLRLVVQQIRKQAPVRGVRSLRFDGGVIDVGDLVTARPLFPDASISVSFSSSECGEIGAFSLDVGEGVPAELLFTPSCEVDLRNVDASGVGEVWARSAQQATGYIRNGQRQVAPTIEGISDPSGFVPSGDLGRIHPDGRLEVIGRNDDLVKIRGFRVHPAETERALRSHVSLSEVVVTPRPLGASGRLRLVAFGEATDRHRRPQSAMLLAALRGELAAASVPSQLVLVDRLPRLPTGKVDRVAVAKLDLPRRQLEHEEATNPTEGAVIDAWERVLGQAPIGRNERFVDLGGDSLDLVEVLSILSDNDDFVVSRAIVAACETPAAIATAIDAGADGTVQVLPQVGLSSGARDPQQDVLRGGRLTVVISGPGVDIGSPRTVRPAISGGACVVDYALLDAKAVRHPEAAVMGIAATIVRRFAPDEVAFVGTCAGGLLCRPLALQLERLGVHVGPTVLIDTRFRNRPEATTRNAMNRVSRLLRGNSLEQVGHTLRSLVADPVGHSRRIVRIVRRTANPAADLVRVVSQPGPSSSPTTLVINSTWNAEQPLLNWGVLAADWRVVELEGTHESLLIGGRDKTLAVIRSALESTIDEAQTRSSRQFPARSSA